MARWDDALGYLIDDRPGLRRIGRLFLIALVIMTIAIGVSLALGNGDQSAPVVDNSTGRYAEGSPSWGLCAAFVVMALVLLTAMMIEIRT